ncbi:MAG: hypothetical protein LBE56_12320 [Tannerella sp.]|jgi:hypothetical protein|nr:hypothetical protein [Tannerella sp.]
MDPEIYKRAIEQERYYMHLHLKRARILAKKEGRIAMWYDYDETLSKSEYAAWERAFLITLTPECRRVDNLMFDAACIELCLEEVKPHNAGIRFLNIRK